MPANVIFDGAAAVCSGILAAVAIPRAGSSLPRWSFVFGMALLSAESVAIALSHATDSPAEILRWQNWRLLILAGIPAAWVLFSLSYARDKDIRFLGMARYALAAAVLVPVAVGLGFRDQLVISVNQATTESGWLVRLGWPGTTLGFLLLIASVWIVANVERTFRASVGTMRWRIKFMLLGVGMLFVVRIYTSSQMLLFRGLDSSLESINSAALILATLLILRSFFRTGHFDLEVYPSQSVLQNSFTILIAGAYLLIVGVLAKVVTYFGGDAAFASKAFLVLVALVLLTIALQSDRARLLLRQFVSRHFHRSPYDYRAVWKTFTEGTASRLDQADLCRGLVRLTADTLHALSVSIWLADDKNEALTLAASTSSAASQEGVMETGKDDISALVRHFQEKPDPVDIEVSDAAWATMLRRHHPSEFANGGNRVCVPMIGRGDVLGVIVVGDRVAGLPFSLEDFDMLKGVGDHAAASILNVQLSKKLVQAKELEAFQAMAAFFVHDLKNAASTLNLMLQNLPVHYDDPAFRADALRGISKTVTHINRLVGRLGLLRHELKIELVESDLNELVSHVLTGVEHAPGFTLRKELRSIPKIGLDRDQMHKVVTNLVLNATEAIPPQGQIRISTEQEDGWVVLTVADTGSGMSADFLSQSLFRPFQTTKKNGLGIGMFQSKMIIEAHGGRIAVKSEPGAGTTFRVFLRVNAPR